MVLTRTKTFGGMHNESMFAATVFTFMFLAVIFAVYTLAIAPYRRDIARLMSNSSVDTSVQPLTLNEAFSPLVSEESRVDDFFHGFSHDYEGESQPLDTHSVSRENDIVLPHSVAA